MSLGKIRTRWKVLGIVLLLFVLANELPRLVSSYPSVVFARDDTGEFQRLAGAEPRPFPLALSAHRSRSHQTSTSSTRSDTQRPLGLSSLTILDVSNTPLSRAVAAELLKTALGRQHLDWVEVRHTDTPCLQSSRIADQILRIEELDASSPWAGVLGVSRAIYSFSLGDLPGWGWNPEAEFSQATSKRGEIRAEMRYFGLPAARGTQLAAEIAEDVDLDALLDAFIETEGPTPPLPAALLPTQADLEGSEALPDAVGIDSPPLLAGARLGCSGEAFWRYAGEDALDVILATRAELQLAGWEVEDAPPVFDKKLHHFRASRDRQRIDVVLDESLAQDVDGETTVNVGPDGRIDRTVLPPLRKGALVLWLHWWKEPTLEDLRGQLARAEEFGPSVRSAYLANLPARQRTELGGGSN